MLLSDISFAGIEDDHLKSCCFILKTTIINNDLFNRNNIFSRDKPHFLCFCWISDNFCVFLEFLVSFCSHLLKKRIDWKVGWIPNRVGTPNDVSLVTNPRFLWEIPNFITLKIPGKRKHHLKQIFCKFQHVIRQINWLSLLYSKNIWQNG